MDEAANQEGAGVCDEKEEGEEAGSRGRRGLLLLLLLSPHTNGMEYNESQVVCVSCWMRACVRQHGL